MKLVEATAPTIPKEWLLNESSAQSHVPALGIQSGYGFFPYSEVSLPTVSSSFRSRLRPGVPERWQGGGAIVGHVSLDKGSR